MLAQSSRDFQNARTPIGYHDLSPPQVTRQKTCICGDDNLPIGREEAVAKHPTKQGRARRQTKEQEAGGPFACADVTIVELLGNENKIRVVDGFGLSTASLMTDEQWGGRQSFDDVSVVSSHRVNGSKEGQNNDRDSIIVLIRRPLKGPFHFPS